MEMRWDTVAGLISTCQVLLEQARAGEAEGKRAEELAERLRLAMSASEAKASGLEALQAGLYPSPRLDLLWLEMAPVPGDHRKIEGTNSRQEIAPGLGWPQEEMAPLSVATGESQRVAMPPTFDRQEPGPKRRRTGKRFDSFW